MITFNEIAEQSKASIEKDDLKILLPLVAQIEPKNILEIGTWKGYSARTWLDAFEPKKFYTLDNDPNVLLDEWTGKKSCDSFYSTRDSHDLKTLTYVKDFFFPELIDFLFIDGDHSYQGVMKDFEMYAPLVRKGGVITFHDAIYHADKTEEVDIFWNEVKTKYPFVEIKVGENSTGIGLIWQTRDL